MLPHEGWYTSPGRRCPSSRSCRRPRLGGCGPLPAAVIARRARVAAVPEVRRSREVPHLLRNEVGGPGLRVALRDLRGRAVEGHPVWGTAESSWLRACDQRLHRCVGGCLIARLVPGQRSRPRRAEQLDWRWRWAGRALFLASSAMPWPPGAVRAAKRCKLRELYRMRSRSVRQTLVDKARRRGVRRKQAPVGATHCSSRYHTLTFNQCFGASGRAPQQFVIPACRLLQ